MATQLVPRELFGGAMQMAMPCSLQDVSDARPVPDHQEVWADGSTDQSVIVEIVEATATDNASSAAFYFDDLAQLNSSSSTVLQQVEVLEPSATPCLSSVPGLFTSIAVGMQHVGKGRTEDEQAKNQVLMLLAVVRLPQVSSDLLITLNMPVHISATSAAAEHAGAGFKADASDARPLMLSMLSTLEIRDWGLFGES